MAHETTNSESVCARENTPACREWMDGSTTLGCFPCSFGFIVLLLVLHAFVKECKDTLL